MTGNVSFYLIAILAQRVKIHSLQERNVFIVDRHVKKKCIYNNYSLQVEVPSREKLPSFEAARLIPPLAIDTEVNNCFSTY